MNGNFRPLDYNYRYLPDQFVEYCKCNEISLEHKDDWSPWWSIWCTGIDNCREMEDLSPIE